MKLNLFFNYYKDKDRQSEIDECLRRNEEVFDNVYIIEGRPTFNQIFELMRQFPNDINCFCNSDIYFTDTSLLRKMNLNDCYALTRYDLKDGKLEFFGRPDSQDAWCFRGAPKKINAPFTTGMWGCDNRLAHEFMRVHYNVSNPSLSIVTVHLHKVDNRDHSRNSNNTIPPPYKTLKPCKI